MFESGYLLRLTDVALEAPWRDVDYHECWSALPKVFDPTNRDVKIVPPSSNGAKK